jgi:hypothetical protein
MKRLKVLVAVVFVAGAGVLAAVTVSGSWGAAPSDAATALQSDPTTTLASDSTTTLSSDPVAVASSEPGVTAAREETLSSAPQTTSDGSTAATNPAEDSGQPPQGTIDDRHRAEVEEAADELLVEMLPVVAEIDANEPIDVAAQLGTIASQAILSELEAERLEFETEGWSRSGTYRVDGVEVLDYTESGESASATIRACLDSSEIVVRRSDGSVVEPGADSQRAWNVYVLERTDDAWRFVGRTFTDDPAC